MDGLINNTTIEDRLLLELKLVYDKIPPLELSL